MLKTEKDSSTPTKKVRSLYELYQVKCTLRPLCAELYKMRCDHVENMRESMWKQADAAFTMTFSLIWGF